MEKRRHRMPFGAELLEHGGVRFRLWAPKANKVELCLDTGSSQIVLRMRADAEGWFSLTTELAKAGSHYFFIIGNRHRVPDPASRFQPSDVHGPSEVIDPRAWSWQDSNWLGRPWHESVIYELHLGCFTARGNFSAAREKLNYLAELGVSAIELMPVADFPGKRNWGYDGTLLFAPDHRYGRPDEMKALIDAAHACNLMVFLDVVYNHFGPEGNYLHLYAPQFFSENHHTPWGAAINFDGQDNHWVRQFFIHNALYWLEEYHIDGLRLDAVHAITDDSTPDILTELAEHVHRHFGNQRHIHLVLENDHNNARYLTRDANKKNKWYVAQWNDDIHHSLHVLLTNEKAGYYQDYIDKPIHHLGRCLSEGFAYQGERSTYRHGQPRGEISGHLPATAFVSFLQNHDQVGNRAFGERINVLTSQEKLRAALSLLLLAPAPPLLFMGQEWGCQQPFLFFCDFAAELAGQVTAGRRDEFADITPFSSPSARQLIPDPMDEQTFLRGVLDWEACCQPQQQKWLLLHRKLLALRQSEITPRLNDMPTEAEHTILSQHAIAARWRLNDGCVLTLLANLGDIPLDGIENPRGRLLYTTHPDQLLPHLPGWFVCWYVDETRQGE